MCSLQFCILHLYINLLHTQIFFLKLITLQGHSRHPIFDCDYICMGGADLKHQMCKLQMVEHRKCLMWDVMLITAIHDYVAILKSMPHFKITDLIKFRLQQIKGVIEEQGSIMSSHVCACPPTEPLPKPHQHHFVDRTPHYWVKGKTSKKINHVF